MARLATSANPARKTVKLGGNISVIYVKAIDGRRVLDPARNPPAPLPPEGAKVEKSIYWRRRLMDGDVTEIIEPNASSLGLARETE